MDSMDTTPVKGPTVTEQNMQYLSDEINRLASYIDTLGSALQPVLTDGPSEKASDSPGYSGNTALNENIASECRRLHNLNEILRALTARIDL